MFSLQQNQRTREQYRFCPEVEWEEWEAAQTMLTHVSKCKNDKIKERRKKWLLLSSTRY
jgi:Fe-S cluster biosynthesis and repair protein YggX